VQQLLLGVVVAACNDVSVLRDTLEGTLVPEGQEVM
jgi:hypothetical protein